VPNLTHRLLLLATLAIAPPIAAQRTPLDSSAGRIVFSVRESFADSTGHTHLVLRVGAERRLRCYSPVGSRVSTRGDTVTVDRWFTSDEGGCIDDESVPPMGSIALPLEPERRVLEIVRLGVVDRYRLTVTSDAIQVRPIGTPRVSVVSDTTRLGRFPRNSLALSCSTGRNTAWTCAEVEHLLADEWGLVPIELPATGRNPYAGWPGEQAGDHVEPVRYFRVDTPASYDRLLRDVQRLYDAYAGRRVDFNVSILPWTGRSWRTVRAR
jgi:hypothetical protein